MKAKLLMTFCLVLTAMVSYAQSREKLYLHLDKDNYVLGDTIWFKSYLVDALTQTPSLRSGIEYVYVMDDQNEVQRRLVLPVSLGMAYGDITLDSIFFQAGKYKIIAYTNWMQNFGDSLFFQKEFSITNGGKGWIMNLSTPKNTKLDGDSSELVIPIQLFSAVGDPLKFKVVQLSLLNKRNRKILSVQEQLDKEGKLLARFRYKDDTNKPPVYLQVTGDNGNERISTWLDPKTIEETDVQFLPESGHLVAGLKNEIGFKAIGEDGKGRNISGTITDNTGKEITAFQSIYKGMGAFTFTPEAGKSYAANTNAKSTDNSNIFNLPPVETSGTIIHVQSNTEDSNVDVAIEATKDLQGKEYYITGIAKGFSVYKAKVVLGANPITANIPKAAFPTGVASFQLQNEKGQIVNERAFFVNNHDQLKIQIETPKNNYHPHDSIPVNITVKDYRGKPVIGTFSLAVTDNNQVTKSIANDQNILSYLLLQSDLKGNIETPGYYFSHSTDTAKAALDALMLTQGFVKYDWDSTTFKYLPEPKFTIRGDVINGLNKPVANAKIVLFSSEKYTIMKDTVTDKKGHFIFDNFPQFDTTAFYIQARGKHGNNYGFELKLHKFQDANLANLSFNNYLYNNNVNVDIGLLKSLLNKQATLGVSSTGLKDVVVTTKVVPHSHNLNGPGKYSQLITRAQIATIPREKGVLGVLEKYAKGYALIPFITNMPNEGRAIKMTPGINGMAFMCVIDGEPQNVQVYTNKHKHPVLDNIEAIEIMCTPATAMPYMNAYMSREERENYIRTQHNLCGAIEITTNIGKGFLPSDKAGVVNFYPYPFYFGRQFYAPRYNIRPGNDTLPDLRSTIYWNPRVVTNEKGRAQVYFYSADHHGFYTIWMEGMDLKGDIGCSTKKIIND